MTSQRSFDIDRAVSNLTLSMPGKSFSSSADDSLTYFSYFTPPPPQKKNGFDSACKLSLMYEMSKPFFQGKMRTHIINLSSAEFAQKEILSDLAQSLRKYRYASSADPDRPAPSESRVMVSYLFVSTITLTANDECHDPTARMRRLIWTFAFVARELA